jgi:hypothetical protein
VARGPHAPPPAKTSKLVDQDRLLLLFLFVPAVHLPITCKATQQHKQYFTFVFLFLLDLPSSPFVNAFFFWVQCRHCLLPFRWLQIEEEAVAGGASAYATMRLRED